MICSNQEPVPEVLYISISEYDDSRHTIMRRVYYSEKAAMSKIELLDTITKMSLSPMSHRVFRCDMVNMTITETTTN